MIKDIRELNFPSYATLESATVTLADMGEKTITAQIKIDGSITPDFSFDWEIEHKGEKYIMPLREPRASVENTSLDSTIDLTFQHWAQYQLKRWYFFTVQPVESGTAVPDKYIASVSLTLPNFITLFNQVLAYYYGNTIKIQLNPAWVSKEEPTTVEINHSYIWDVLLKLHELYAVRWTIEADPNNEGHYIIKVGYEAEEISHVFEYGFEGGLLKVERQVQNENIRNMLIGRGGEKNLPYRYYKDIDENNDSFPADPDWIPELANLHFDVLRGATFRSYIQGWKAKHYNGKTTKVNAYAPWAWEKGYTDAKFNPIEYVKDDESIAKYGPLEGGFDDNEDFYPTIQGVNSADHINFFGTDFGRVDQIVAVEKITKDESEIVKPNDAAVEKRPEIIANAGDIEKLSRKTITVYSDLFNIPEGKYGDFDEGVKTLSVTKKGVTHKNPITGAFSIIPTIIDVEYDNSGSKVILEDATLTVVNSVGLDERSASGIPPGSWKAKLRFTVYNSSDDKINAKVSCENVTLTTATPDEELNGAFDIWIKNIWGTTKKSTETNKEYAERVWLPILGGSDGSEAKIVFSSGWLSTSEDYEFMIVKGGINYDTTKTLTKDGKTSQSHWRLTLARCDAEYEATGKYIPNKELNANDGDYFFFTGIDMPNAYTVWTEERLDNWKKDQLLKVANIRPTWVVETDRVRMNNYGNPGTLIDQIKPGFSVALRDERFISSENHEETLYIQSVTYIYRKPSSTDNALNPDVEMTLGKEYAVSGSIVEQLQGDIEVLQRQIGSISNIAEIVESIGNKKFIRKDHNDKTPHSLEIGGSLDVNDRIDLGDFLAGVSGARLGVDKESGKSFLEVDNIVARVKAYFEQLTIINADTVAGRQYITSGGSVRCAEVEETATAYRCYFLSEQDGEKTETYIRKGDQAIAEMFNATEGTANKVSNHRWWRLVTDVQQSVYTDASGNKHGYIEVSKADCETGSSAPKAGDVICQLGSRDDASRQAAMIFDTIGSNAPSVTLLTGIGSGTTNAEHYSLAGRAVISFGYDHTKGEVYFRLGESGATQYLDYTQGGGLKVAGEISVESTVGDKTITDYISEEAEKATESFDYLKAVLKDRTIIDSGLMLSTLLKMGQNNGTDLQSTWSGISGIYDKTLLGRSIGSWWGGDMIDLFNPDGTLKVPAPANAAASLVRMDGSAYWGKGLFGFETDGSGWFGTGDSKITFKAGSMTFGNGIKIDINGTASGLQTTLESVLNFSNTLAAAFKPCYLEGDEFKETEWPRIADGTYTLAAVKAKVGFFSESFISAKGVNPLTGAVGGTGAAFGRLDDWARYDAGAGDSLSATLGYGLKTAIDGHTGDTGIHVSAADRARWNGAAAIMESDTDNAVNKWNEVVAFLATYTEADTLATLLSNKVDKETGKGLSTNDFTTALLNKLNGIEAGANNYTLPTATSSVLGGVRIGANISVGADGTISTHAPYELTKGKVEAVLTGSVATHTHDKITATAVGDLNAFKGDNLTWGFMGGGNSTANKPAGVDAFGVINLKSASTWYSQILRSSNSNNGLYVRDYNGTSWGDWIKTLDERNYAAVINATHVSRTEAQTVGGTKTFTANPIVSTVAMVTSTGLTMTQEKDTTSIYKDGIGIRGGTNDGAFIRFVESTANAGYLEIATGDDATEPIYVRQYNTSGAAGHGITLMDGDGNQRLNAVTALKGLTIPAGQKLTLGGATLEWDEAAQGIKVSHGLYSLTYISAKGAAAGGTGAGATGSNYDRLDAWGDYTSAKEGHVLSAKLGWDLRQNKLSTTEAAALYQPKGNYLTAHQALDHINYLGTTNAVSGTATFSGGLRLYGVYSGGYPSVYGNLLRIGGGGFGELLCGWTADTSNGHLYYRSKRDVPATEWSAWATVLDSLNYTSYAAAKDHTHSQYLPFSTQTAAYTNGTSLNPQVINVQSENLIGGYHDYWSVINIGSYSGGGYRSQMAMPYQNSIDDTDLFIRTANGSTWRPWRRVLHEGNYASVLGSVYQAKGSYVDIASAQTITGQKTFTAQGLKLCDDARGIIFYRDLRGKAGAIEIVGANGVWAQTCIEFENSGDVTFNHKIIKSGGTASQFLKADGSVDSKNYLFSRRYGTDLDIDSTETVTARIIETSSQLGTMPNNNGWHSYFNWGSADPGYGIQLCSDYSRESSLFLRQKVSNVWKGWKTLLDSSNYTAFALSLNGGAMNNTNTVTNLNADLLDGKHNGDLTANRFGSIATITDLDNPTCVDVGVTFNRFEVSAANRPEYFDNANWVLNMFDGKFGTSGLYGGQLAAVNQKGLYWRNWSSGTKGPWRRLAFITDNVASATKLATTRTIWGRDFNGEGNVDGPLTINYTGETGLAIYRKEADCGAFVRLYNANQTENYFRIGMYGDGHFGVCRNSGTDAIAVTAALNVAVGKSTADYKLDVEGSIGFKQRLRFTNGDATMAVYGVRSDAANQTEGVGIQTSFDNQDPETSAYPAAYPKRAVLALQPRGGYVGVGTSTPSCALDVSGSARVAGSIKIGEATLSYDTSTGMLKIDKGLYSEGGISAKGMSPSEAAGTAGDTLNTAGASNLATKLFLVGAPTQADGVRTYSNAGVYMIAGKLYSNGSMTVNLADAQVITGTKTFASVVTINDSAHLKIKDMTLRQDGLYFGGVKTVACDAPDNRLDLGLDDDTDIHFHGSPHWSSDERLKERLGDTGLTLEQVAGMPAWRFRWLTTGRVDVGSTAQYWRDALPEVTGKRDDGRMTLDYGRTALLALKPVAVETMELRAEVKRLRTEVATLRAMVA